MPSIKNALANWKTTAAGVAWFALYGLQSVGVVIPGVHVDPSSLPLALALIFAADHKAPAAVVAPKNQP